MEKGEKNGSSVQPRIIVLNENDVDKSTRIVFASLKEKARENRLKAESTTKVNEILCLKIDQLEKDLSVAQKTNESIRKFFGNSLRDMRDQIEALEEENIILKARLVRKRGKRERFSTI